MKTRTAQILALGLLPWPAVWLGSYALHSAAASFLFYHLLCLAVWAVNRRRMAFQPQAVPAGVWIVLVLVACTAMAATYFAVGLLAWLIEPARIHRALVAQHMGTSPVDYAALCAYFALVNPIAEELFWRRTIYLRLRSEGLSATRAALSSAILFGAWHWLVIRLFFPTGWAVALTLGIMAAGFLFATVFERTRSVIFTALLHALAADIPILLALWFGVITKA